MFLSLHVNSIFYLFEPVLVLIDDACLLRVTSRYFSDFIHLSADDSVLLAEFPIFQR